MSRRASRVGCAVLLVLAALVFLAPAASARTFTYCDGDPAAALIKAQEYDAARQLYTATLAKDPSDACARKGIAYIADQEATAPQTPLKRSSSRWSTFYTSWLAPLGELALVALGIFVVLLVIGRLLTGTFVATTAIARTGRWRWAYFAVGLGSLAAASAAPILASQFDGRPDRWVGFIWAAALVGGVIAYAVGPREDKHLDGPTGARWRYWLALAGGTALLGCAIAIWVIPPYWATILWVTGAGLALIGLPFFAIWRGQALRIRFAVSGTSGSADSNALAYLAAQMLALGSRPPQGLEVATQTDVTALPDDALTSLPQGRVAAAVLNALRAAGVGVPWQVSVGLVDAETATITVTRNGRTSDDLTILIRRRDLSLAALESTADDAAKSLAERELLTACAAYVLVLLSKRHESLEPGLCGATEWRSVAIYTIAMGRRREASPGDWESMVAAAVDADRNNLLARVAAVHARRHVMNAAEQVTFAQQMAAEYARAFPPVPNAQPPKDRVAAGREAQQLRMLFSLAAGWLNVHLLLPVGGQQDGVSRADAVQRAADACYKLVARLDELAVKKVSEQPAAALAEQLKAPVRYVLDNIAYRLGQPVSGAMHSARETAKKWGDDVPALSRAARYQRSCAFTSRVPFTTAIAKQALDDLEYAATDDLYRRFAQTDPSFRTFADPESAVGFASYSRYKSIVGDPPEADVFGLPLFAGRADTLKSAGIASLQTLANASTFDVAARTSVATSVVRDWQELARLAIDLRAPSEPLSADELSVLLGVSVQSRAELRARLQGDRAAFLTELITAAAQTAVAPSAGQLDEWAQRLG